MASIDTQWAMQSLLQLGHHHIRNRAATVSLSPSCLVLPTPPSSSSVSKAVRVTAMPQLMRASCAPSHVLLLAKRPSGIAGVTLRPGNPMPWSGLPTAAAELSPTRPHCSKKSRLLASYFQRRGFSMLPPLSTEGQLTPPYLFRPIPKPIPLLLHTNHLIGWKLNDASPAFPVYAHTIDELKHLRSRDIAALQPRNCLIASEYCEWDNWREVLGEPGWDFLSAEDNTIERLLERGLAASTIEEKSGFYPIKVL